PVLEDAARRLRAYAGTMEVPLEHRYGRTSAVADETGIVSVPPPVHDPVPLRVGLAVGAATVAWRLLRR
ncbi:MAG: hypothetical protein WBA11_04105, partial [Rubrivirga sp.]